MRSRDESQAHVELLAATAGGGAGKTHRHLEQKIEQSSLDEQFITSVEYSHLRSPHPALHLLGRYTRTRIGS